MRAEPGSDLRTNLTDDDLDLFRPCIVARQHLRVAQALVFKQDFLGQVGAVDTPSGRVQLRSHHAHLFLENERIGMGQLSHGMNPKSGKAFGGALVNAPDISNLRDGPDLLLDRVIGDLANETRIMLSVDVQRDFGLQRILAHAYRGNQLQTVMNGLLDLLNDFDWIIPEQK